MSPLTKLLYNKYYIDELYQAVFVRPLQAFGRLFQKFIDNALIDGIIGGVNKGVILGSQTARLMQTGSTGFYVFAMVFGIIAILLFNLLL